MDERTPIIVGVGEASERLSDPNYAARSPVDLASQAARAALHDAGAASPPEAHLQLIAGVRQFEVSHPKAIAPFGRSDNLPAPSPSASPPIRRGRSSNPQAARGPSTS